MIVVEKLVKSFNTTRVLQGVDHAQERGEAVVLIGPSGCGKSTFLRCLNQLEIADEGRITIGGVTMEGGHAPRSREERERQRQLRLQAGMVFQCIQPFSPSDRLGKHRPPAHCGSRRGPGGRGGAGASAPGQGRIGKARPTLIRPSFPAANNSG